MAKADRTPIGLKVRIRSKYRSDDARMIFADYDISSDKILRRLGLDLSISRSDVADIRSDTRHTMRLLDEKGLLVTPLNKH